MSMPRQVSCTSDREPLAMPTVSSLTATEMLAVDIATAPAAVAELETNPVVASTADFAACPPNQATNISVHRQRRV